MASSSVEIPDDLPPMSTGLFGYFGYEMIQYMENITSTNPDELGTPDACLMRPSVVVIIDRLKDSLRVVTPVRPDSHDGNHENAIQDGHDRLQNIVNTLNKNISSRQKPEPHTPLPEVSTNMPKSTYLGMVKKAIEYIKAGDIFQVVLSQRFSVPFFKKPFTLYRSLRRLNPSPFSSILIWVVIHWLDQVRKFWFGFVKVTLPSGQLPALAHGAKPLKKTKTLPLIY